MAVTLIRCSYISGVPSNESIIQQQVALIVDLMDKLHNIYNFDNIIVYRTRSKVFEPPPENGLMLKTRNRNVDEFTDQLIHKSVANVLANYIFSRKIHKPLMTFTISPENYVNATDSIPNLGKILTNKNLAIVILNDIFNTELKQFVATSLGASLETKIVFLLIGHEMTGVFSFIRVEKLSRFFRWCWSRNILNALLLFQKDVLKTILSDLKLEVYTYTPFPNPIETIRLTGQHIGEYFKDTTTDLKGYEFKAPIYPDKPSVFKYPHPITGIETVTGIGGHIYMEFVKNMNATFEELPREDGDILSMPNIYDLLNARNIDISIHPHTALLPNKFFSSYPISNTNSCIVVPVIPEIFPGLYIPQTLSRYMWLVMMMVSSGFIATFILIDYRNYGQWRLWQSFSCTLRGILSMPLHNMITDVGLNTFIRNIQLFVSIFLLITGILYCQLFIAGLSSILSSGLYPPQLETIEDLRSANITIMLVKYLFKIYNYLDLIPDNFLDHIKMSDTETVSRHLNTLNNSYAYIVYNDEWKAMERLQMNLRKPRFRIVPSLCISNIYLTFVMQFNSPFYHPLKQFILRTQSTGLEAKWSDMVFLEIQQSSDVNAFDFKDQTHPIPLTNDHFSYMWYSYAFGIMMSLIVFIWELWRGKN